MSRSKDASSKLHEKHQLALADLLRDEDNKYCADCMTKGPRWASWNLGVFMCIRCAGIHRNLGVHISRVKSVNLDSWTPEQIESIQKGGNGRAKSLYEANLPTNFRRPQDDYAVEQFIRAKYQRKQYMSRGGSCEGSTSKQAAKEAQEQKTKNKPKKNSSLASTQKSSHDQVLSVPRPTSVGRSSSPASQPPKPTPSSTKTSGSNLISLDTGTSSSKATKKSSPQPTVDLLTGLTTGTASSTTPSLVNTQAQEAQSTGSEPFIGMQPSLSGSGSSTKDSIMSLYTAQNQPQLSYTAQGYPVNSSHYQQQQKAAMRMAHIAAIQQHQVNQVTVQMQQIKIHQQQHATPVPSGPQAFSRGMNNSGVGVGGGQTLNPTLW